MHIYLVRPALDSAPDRLIQIPDRYGKTNNKPAFSFIRFENILYHYTGARHTGSVFARVFTEVEHGFTLDNIATEIPL